MLSQKRCCRRGRMGVYVCRSDGGGPRFAVSVGRTAADAVGRNRLKRLGRESFRLNRRQLDGRYDYLLIIGGGKKGPKKTEAEKEGILRISFREFEALFLELAGRATNDK